MNKQNCFVIMPYGRKKAYQGPWINFDDIYQDLIVPAVEGADLNCVRCDDIEKPGSIHRSMIEQINSAAVALVDLTTFNPNVFYELGVRHALKRSVTVLIARSGTKVPFNLQGLKVLSYNPKDSKKVKAAIRKHIRSGLEDIGSDSLVFDVLKLPVTTGPELPTLRYGKETFTVRKKNLKTGPAISILTGQLQDITGIDVWANSENNNMQMARMWDRSFSSTIRYLGARKSTSGQIKKDLVEDQLTAKVGNWATVADATVIAMDPCELRTRGVKCIFHVAAVKGGTPGGGYKQIPNVGDCVTNSLREMETKKFSTILFPLFGAGTGRADIEHTADALISAATDHLCRQRTSVMEVFFIARTEVEYNACRKAIRRQIGAGRLQAA